MKFRIFSRQIIVSALLPKLQHWLPILIMKEKVVMASCLNSRTLSGATLLTSSPASDYTLLRLNSKPPASYQPYYAGWNADDLPSDHVSGVHHPEGLTKKLAIDNDTISTNQDIIQWQESTSSPAASHWQVNFDVGQTAGGSSGSPLVQ